MDIKTKLQQCRRDNHQPGKRVTILGAGIAGLVAAYELERLGHQVDIMEGSPRLGGRIWTYRFGNKPEAPYGELGAMRIPRQHEYVMHYVHSLGLGDKLRKFVTMFEEHNALVKINGAVLRIQDAPQAIQNLYQGFFVDKRYSEKTRLFAAWLKATVDAIGSGELRECLQRDLNSHLMDELEKLDLAPFFDSQGQIADLNAFIKAYPSFRSKCSKALNLFFDDFFLIETSHDLLQLEGGMDQLTDHLAAAIKGPISCNREVVALRIDKEHVEVSWLEAGSLHTRFCDYVLCTIPFSVLRRMELSGFDDDKLATIHTSLYWPATKVLFLCARPFWQESGIFGGASFSDDIRQIYYPSIQRDPSRSSVLLASYTIGNDAAYLEMMSEEDRYNYVKDALSRLHPEINAPGTLLNMTNITWGKYKWSSGGCSIPLSSNSFSNSSQHQDLIPQTEFVHYQKTARAQNTLFFAGEHCSKLPAWLQGSVESALEAVHDIVSHKPLTSLAKKPSLILDKG